MQELKQKLGDEDRVVLPDSSLGAGHDEDLAAFEDAGEVESVRVPEESVDLARGDQPLELVARWVEGLRGVATVGEQRGKLPLPIRPCEVGTGNLLESRHDPASVIGVAEVEHPVDVPERR